MKTRTMARMKTTTRRSDTGVAFQIISGHAVNDDGYLEIGFITCGFFTLLALLIAFVPV